MLLFNLAQGLRKFWLLPYNGQTNFVFNIFKGWAWNKICSLVCLKVKNEEILKQFGFSFDQVKKFVFPFLGPKNRYIKKIWILFLTIVLCSKRKLFANLKKSFLRSLWFLEVKILACICIRVHQIFFVCKFQKGYASLGF